MNPQTMTEPNVAVVSKKGERELRIERMMKSGMEGGMNQSYQALDRLLAAQ